MRSFKKLRLHAVISMVMFLIVLITSLLSGCYFFPKEEEVLAPPLKEPEKVSFETIEVKKGTIESDVRCTGTFVSVRQTDLYYKNRGGRLESLDVVLGDKVKKGQLIATLETDIMENDIKLQEIAVKKAQIAYDDVKTRQNIEGGGNKAAVEEAELDLEAAKLRLQALNDEKDSAKMISPVDGNVVYITDTKLGEQVNAHQTIVRVADPTQLQVEYSGDKVSDFKLGMKPELTFSDKTFTGEVVATPLEMPEDVDGNQRRAIRIKADEIPEGVSIGSTVSIKLVLEKHDNVIVLPKSVVNSLASRRFVNVLKNGIREEVDVELGLQTDTEAEIVKGLNVGDLVIIR